MKNNIKDKSIAQLLQSIRTEGPNSDETVKSLFFVLTGKEDAEGWGHQKCLDFYESILRHYNDNKDDLELLLAASGVSPGYRSIEAAIERREKYLAFLEETDSDSKYRRKDPENTLRKTENRLLGNIAKRLEDDLKCGSIPQLIKKWIPEPEKEEELLSDEPKPPPPPPGASSEKDPPPGDPEVPSKSSKIHISRDINNNLIIQFNGIDIRFQWLILPTCAMLLVIGFIIYACFLRSANEPSVQNNVLIPGEIRQIVIVMPSGESIDKLLEYVSSDPGLIEVSDDGFLLAHQGQPGETRRTAEITVKDENGVIATQQFTVDFTGDSYDPPVEDVNDFVPSFLVIQKIRLAGTTEWGTSVNAEIGDIVEIQVKYENISELTHENVMILDVLPPNLDYIPGTTKLYNAEYDGAKVDQDTIAKTGINIGNYTPGSNAYVRFSAKVVDVNLAPGSNTLVNWSKGGVGPVTLQDYAAAVVQK